MPTSSNAPRRIRYVILGVLAVVALYGVIGAFVVPPIAKHKIEEELGTRLGRRVAVDDVAANPYTLQASVRGLRIYEPDKRTVFAGFDRLDLDGSAVSYYRLAPVVDEVILEGLKVNLVRDGESHYNASDILARLAKAPAGGERARFSLANLRVRGARVDFDDQPAHAKHQVTDIDIAIPLLSNLPTNLKEFVQPRFAAKVNGSGLHFTGETQPFENSLRTHLAIDLDGVDITRYVGYAPASLPAKVEHGTLDAHLQVHFIHAAGQRDPSVDIAGTLALHDFAVVGTDASPLARLTRADIKIDALDPLGGVARVASIALSGLDAGEGIHAASVQVKDISAEAAKHHVRVGSVALDEGSVALHRAADGSIEMPVRVAKSEAAAQPAGEPWLFEVGKLTAAGYKIAVADDAVKPKALHRIVLAKLEASGISTAKGAKAALAAQLAGDKGGTIDVDGTAGIDPLDVAAAIDVRRIDLVPLRVYARHFQTVALKSAFASAKGQLKLRDDGGKLRVAYEGSAALTKVATRDTTADADLLNWDSVKAAGIAVKWSGADEPLEAAVNDIAVDNAYARVIVTPEGKINLQQLKFATADDPTAAQAPAGPPQPRNVRIGRITFAASRLDFTDLFIKPNYSADVGELGGAVANLSSDPASRATVDLKGSWDGTSPVIIAGTVNPLSGNLFLDIAAKGSGIDLTKLSAYSARYAGYGIQQGKLTLDVKYHVEDGKLEGHNNIFLDQLTFGEKVDSPEATKLPVLFVVNLLKDSEGHINLELPISGSLADPKFEIGALIGQVISGFFTKASKSPFSMIAAASGDGASGDDLAYVEFEPGSDAIGAAGEKKLATLSNALRNRPALKLEMTSRPDMDADVNALKRTALMKKLGEGKDKPLTAEEYQKAVKAAYEKEAPKPKEAKEQKEVSQADMEAFLLDKIQPDPAALTALASARIERVRAYLTGNGKLPSERLLVAAAKEADTSGVRRVNFTLK